MYRGIGGIGNELGLLVLLAGLSEKNMKEE